MATTNLLNLDIGTNIKVPLETGGTHSFVLAHIGNPFNNNSAYKGRTNFTSNSCFLVSLDTISGAEWQGYDTNSSSFNWLYSFKITAALEAFLKTLKSNVVAGAIQSPMLGYGLNSSSTVISAYMDSQEAGDYSCKCYLLFAGMLTNGEGVGGAAASETGIQLDYFKTQSKRGSSSPYWTASVEQLGNAYVCFTDGVLGGRSYDQIYDIRPWFALNGEEWGVDTSTGELKSLKVSDVTCEFGQVTDSGQYNKLAAGSMLNTPFLKTPLQTYSGKLYIKLTPEDAENAPSSFSVIPYISAINEFTGSEAEKNELLSMGNWTITYNSSQYNMYNIIPDSLLPLFDITQDTWRKFRTTPNTGFIRMLFKKVTDNKVFGGADFYKNRPTSFTTVLTSNTPFSLSSGDITLALLSYSGDLSSVASVEVKVTNNANDTSPIWQDCTDEFQNAKNIIFNNVNRINNAAFNFKILIKMLSANNARSEPYISSIQGAFQ